MRAANPQDRWAEAAAGLVLVAALLFGGGPKGAGDLAVHLAAIPAGVLAVQRWPLTPASALRRVLAWLGIASLALLGLQLVPLPEVAWGLSAPRAALAADLQRMGVPVSGLPWSLNTWGTVRALLAVATTLALWALVCTLTAVAQRRLLILVVCGGVLTALVGFAQAAHGTHSPLRPFAYHHPIGAIGLFANRNHFASLMAMLLPFALGLAFHAQRQQRSGQAAAWYGAAVVLALAAALSFSRMGGLLALLAGLASAGLGLRSGGGSRKRWWAPLAAMAIAAAGVAVYAWSGIAQRMSQEVADDLRWQYLRYGWLAAKAYLPWGSGAGTFREAYAPFEPVGAMVHVHALHAHNDWLQVLVELGVPGLALALAVAGTVLFAAIRPTGKTPIASHFPPEILTAAAIAAVVPLLHSFVDYPLRTLAVATTFAMCMALLTASTQRAH